MSVGFVGARSVASQAEGRSRMQFKILLEGLSEQGPTRSSNSQGNITEQSTTEEQNKKKDQTNPLHNDDAIQNHSSSLIQQTVKDHLCSALPNELEVPPAFGNKNDKYITSTISPLDGTPADQDEPIVVSLTEKAKARLAMIGLAIADFVFFVNWFIGHRWQFVQRPPDGDWSSPKTTTGRPPYLNDWRLVRHLAGDIVVGTGCRWSNSARALRTPYIAIDIDHNGSDADLRDRYDRVVAALGPPTYVIRSSDSGGLHVYYILTRPELLHALRTSDGKRGDVVCLLKSEGLHHQNGRVEIYPQGQYKDLGQGNRLRAPFGVGSCLLDPRTLATLAEPGPASLIRAREMFERGQVVLVDPMAWAAKRRALPSIPPVVAGCQASTPAPVAKPVTRCRHRRGSPLHVPPTSRHDEAKVQRLLEEGLTNGRELHDGATALAFYFRHGLLLSEEEASTRMIEWLHAHHNGKSRKYNKNPKHAVAQVTGVVERVYKRKPKAVIRVHARKWVRVETLSEFEARSVFAAFANDADACDPATGELLDPYKLRLFGFEVLRLAKQNVLTFLADAIRAAGDQPVPDDVIASIWPDRSTPEFIVISPYELREGRGRTGTGFLKGIGRDSRYGYWRTIQHAGLFQLRRKAWHFPWGAQAARYVVRLDFGAYSSDGVAFATVDAALVGLLTEDELRTRFTEYRRRRLAKGSNVGTPPPDEDDAARQAHALIVRLVREAANHDDWSGVDAA
jgi:hypothetical protein